MAEHINDSELPAVAANRIKLILMDCDGVMTDGRLYFSSTGEIMKVFNVRDGQGLSRWHAAGGMSGVISGRDAGEIIKIRGNELGITYIKVKSTDKTRDFFEIINAAGVSPAETAYIGDDVGDIDVMKLVGFPVAVADAAVEVLPFAAFVTLKSGGHGAVRELIDHILRSRS